METTFTKKTIILVTGVFGHIGHALLPLLVATGARIRAIIHPRDLSDERLPYPIELIRGDLRSMESIKAAFIHKDDERLIVIHMASIISTLQGGFKRLYRTNVVGTRNMLALALNNKASRFLYVSSVHALTESPKGSVTKEHKDFDMKSVKGVYAKTKAIASKLVLSYADRLDVVIVHPAGVIGPYDYQKSQTNQVFYDYLDKKLPYIINGGYDFVDVSDVATGIMQAMIKGRRGENYILGNRYVTIKEMITILSQITGGKSPKVLPLWLAKSVAPFVEAWAKMIRRRPLFTPYSLYTASSNGHYSHEKAEIELGYKTTPLEVTIRDIQQWYVDVLLKPKRMKAHRKKYL